MTDRGSQFRSLGAIWTFAQEGLVHTGADAIGVAEQKVADLEEQIDTICDLSTSLALNDL